MTLTSVQLPAAALRWRLDGPAGPQIDTLIGALIGAGVGVECITPGTAYRLDGPRDMLEALAAELNVAPEFALRNEMPPSQHVGVASTLTPAAAPRRAVVVHGAGVAASFVARAVDRRLDVSTIGINRWSVRGSTAALVDWLAAAYGKTRDEVLTLHEWTAEQVAAEDSPTPLVSVNAPPVNVNVQLPDRRITSEITRNAEGDITNVVQLETNAK